MGMRLEEFREVEKPENGVWIKHPNGGSFLIAPFITPSGSNFLTKRLRPYKDAKEGISAEDDIEIATEHLEKFVLLGWKDIENADGSAFEFNPENVRFVLTRHPAIRTWIIRRSQERANFLEKHLEELAGN